MPMVTRFTDRVPRARILHQVLIKTLTAANGEVKDFFPSAEAFYKWVGGKRALMKQLQYLLPCPSRYGSYIEPFLGGGSMFFHLQGTGALEGKKVVLADLNDNLTSAWTTLRDHREAFLYALRRTNFEYTEAEYMSIRAQFNDRMRVKSPAQKALLFMYLLNTCINGIYRVSKKSGFNVKWAGPKPDGFQLITEDRARAVQRALVGVEIIAAPFSKVLREHAGEGTFSYLDPPYYTEKGFTSYTSSGFGRLELYDLRQTCDWLYRRGGLWMMSNSFHPDLMRFFSDPAEMQDLVVNRSVVFRGNTVKAKGSKGSELVGEYVLRGGFRTPGDSIFVRQARELEKNLPMETEEVVPKKPPGRPRKQKPPLVSPGQGDLFTGMPDKQS